MTLSPIAAALAVGLAIAPVLPAAADHAERVAIDVGHVDMGPRIVDGQWVIQVRDDSKEPVVWRDMDHVVLVALPQSQLTIPSAPEFEFLGQAGDPVWIMPQTQQENLLWPGWNTQDPSVNALIDSDGVTWSLDAIDGPGDLVLYLDGSFGDRMVLFDTKQPLPQTMSIEANSHVHGNWAFSEPGAYVIDITMRSALTDGREVTDSQELMFFVGEGDPMSMFDGPGSTGSGVEEPPGESPAGTPDGSESETPVTGSEEPATTEASPAEPASSSQPESQPDSAASSAPAATDTASQAQEVDGSSGLPVWLWILLAVVVVGGVVIVLVLRRRGKPNS